MLICSIDIETTGFDHENCDILQFGAVIDDFSNPEPRYESLPKFEALFIKNNYTGSPFALSMHSELFKKIDYAKKNNLEEGPDGVRYMPIEDLPTSFECFLLCNGFKQEKNEKIYVNVAGKNVGSFDIPFLQAKVKNWGNVYFLNRVLDPAILYFENGKDNKLPDMKTCMERAGLCGEVAHTASEDAITVLKLLRHKMINKSSGKKTKSRNS